MKTYNLLSETIISIQTGEQITLPQVLLGLDTGEITGFPKLLPYHIKTWHSFLVQLAVLAISRFDGRPKTAEDWAEALVKLTGGEQYWDMVSPPGEPAFMQSPLSTEMQQIAHKSAKKTPKTTPDGLDILVTANNHYVKQNRNVDAAMEDWLYALVVHQTEASYCGVKNYGASRAPSELQARVFAGVFPIKGKSMTVNFGAWFQQDVNGLLTQRAAASAKEKKRFSKPGVLWPLKWDFSFKPPKDDGKGGDKDDENEKKQKRADCPVNSIKVTSLDPLYIDQSRVLKLFWNEGKVEAVTGGSTAPRVHVSQFQRDTDPWAILSYKKEKNQVGYIPWGYPSLSPRPFDYRLICSFLTSDDFRFSHREFVDWEAESLGLYVDFIRKGQGKTLGHKHVFIPLPRASKDIFFGAEDQHSVMSRMLDLVREKMRTSARAARVYLAKGDMELASSPDFVRTPKVSNCCGELSEAVHLDVDGYFMREWAALLDLADDHEEFDERFSVFENRVNKSCKTAYEQFLSRTRVPSSSRLRAESYSRDTFYQGITRKAS